MTSAWSGLAGALLGGLAAYGLFHWVLWDVPMASLGSLIGLAALIGGGLGSWLARRRAVPPGTGGSAAAPAAPAAPGAAAPAPSSSAPNVPAVLPAASAPAAGTLPNPPDGLAGPGAPAPTPLGAEPPTTPRNPS